MILTKLTTLFIAIAAISAHAIKNGGEDQNLVDIIMGLQTAILQLEEKVEIIEKEQNEIEGLFINPRFSHFFLSWNLILFIVVLTGVLQYSSNYSSGGILRIVQNCYRQKGLSELRSVVNTPMWKSES